MRPFHDVATDYCAGMECPEQRANFAEWLPRILAELLHAALHLPHDGIADAGAEDFKRPDRRKLEATLPLLPLQYYREIFNPLEIESTSDPVTGDLYDDLADIYCDLSEGLFIHQNVSSKEAERYWGQSFWYHWGEHLTGALRALYWSHREGSLGI